MHFISVFLVVTEQKTSAEKSWNLPGLACIICMLDAAALSVLVLYPTYPGVWKEMAATSKTLPITGLGESLYSATQKSVPWELAVPVRGLLEQQWESP